MNEVSSEVSMAVMMGLTECSRGRGRPQLCWLDIFTWTVLKDVKLLMAVRDRKCWYEVNHNCSKACVDMTWQYLAENGTAFCVRPFRLDSTWNRKRHILCWFKYLVMYEESLRVIRKFCLVWMVLSHYHKCHNIVLFCTEVHRFIDDDYCKTRIFCVHQIFASRKKSQN